MCLGWPESAAASNGGRWLSRAASACYIALLGCIQSGSQERCLVMAETSSSVWPVGGHCWLCSVGTCPHGSLCSCISLSPYAVAIPRYAVSPPLVRGH